MLGPPPGPRWRRFGPPGSKRAVLTPQLRCFRGPHELAFIRSKIFIHPQFASSARLFAHIAIRVAFRSRFELFSNAGSGDRGRRRLRDVMCIFILVWRFVFRFRFWVKAVYNTLRRDAASVFAPAPMREL